jgi:hypothetical protein
MENIFEGAKITRVANAAVAAGSDVNGSAIDMAGFDEVSFLALLGEVSAGGVPALKVQQSTDAGVADAWADITSASKAGTESSDNMVLGVTVYRPQERYVRAVLTRGGGNAVLDGIVCVQSQAKKGPVTHDATTVVGVTTVMPSA